MVVCFPEVVTYGSKPHDGRKSLTPNVRVQLKSQELVITRGIEDRDCRVVNICEVLGQKYKARHRLVC
jgi:hypothetical protein